METKDTFYLYRLCVICILVAMLIFSIITTGDTQLLFSSILLFLLPMILDYYSQNPVSKKNKSRKEFVIIVSILASTATLLLLIIIGDHDIKEGISWWKFILSLTFIPYVIVAIYDWIGYSSPEEMAHRKKIKQIGQAKAKSAKGAQPSSSS